MPFLLAIFCLKKYLLFISSSAIILAMSCRMLIGIKRKALWEVGSPRGLFPEFGRLGRQTICLLAVEPFADIIGDDARLYGQQKVQKVLQDAHLSCSFPCNKADKTKKRVTDSNCAL